ncbi:hypothetical protein HPP92_024609 [Vanilla planifolia]|uniref:Uncharacterized protein n=1 Tax=Vanilla planifolia TaxID=51239 RepID=A0A835UEU8_VANPL|nr:hypothetical protein HPP92_024609 [Vanilla planifolia]
MMFCLPSLIKKLQNDSNKHPEKGGEQIEDVLVQRTDKNSNANATYKKSSPNIMFYSHGEPHSEINSLTQLFVDDMDKSSSHNIPLKVKASEVPSEDQIKQIRKEKVSIYAEVNTTACMILPTFSRQDIWKKQSQGKS